MALIDEKKNQEQELIDAAQAAIEQQTSRGGYSSPWQESLNATIDKILNREKFSYDMNTDAFYQQAKDRYVQQGKQAMMDTIGQASALTGGYGNSYAQTVGQQAYHGYLQGLNDKLLDFYGVARGAYDAETDDLYNQFNLYNERDKQDYARYVDDRDYNEQVRQFLAMNPQVIPYYQQLLGEDGKVNLEALANAALGISGNTGLGGIGGGSLKNLESDPNIKKPSSDHIEIDPVVPENNKSGFEQATGNSRYDNTGTEFTKKELLNTTGKPGSQVTSGFEWELGMTRTNGGRANMIADALIEGKITDAQADKYQKQYNISDEEFKKALGMTEGGQNSYTQVGMTDYMKKLLQKGGSKPYGISSSVGISSSSAHIR